MHTEDLFATYAQTPRPADLAPSLREGLRGAVRVVLATAVGSGIVGVMLSFLRGRRSRPWEPIDMLIAAAIVATFAVPLSAIGVVIFRRYLTLFQNGRLVEGHVIAQRAGGAVLQVAVGAGPDHTFIPDLTTRIGERHPVIVGDLASSLALVVAGPGDVRRGSLLTAAQLSQVAGAHG